MRMPTRPTILLLALLIGPAHAAADTFTVNSTANGSDASPGNGVCRTNGNNGACTLRAAIQESNARSGVDTIRFAIGTGVQRISFASTSVLPAITSPVIIDGWTQPGFAGTPLIELRGGSGDGLRITGGNSTVRGLVINGFSGRGVVLTDRGNNVLEGNYIGLDVAGVDAVPNDASGVYIEDSTNNRIGGTTLQQRNLISGNMPEYTPGGNFGGIEIHDGGGNVIQGNFIGTDVTGMEDRGNTGRGISLVHTFNNVIGGPEAGAANLIAGNFATGVRVRDGSTGTLIQGNIIGLNRTMTAGLSNDRGVQIRGSHDNTVVGNVIGGHVFNGVIIWQGSNNNRILSNWILYNGFAERDDSCSVCTDQEDYNGVLIMDGTGNYVIGNAIYGNREYGIVVAPDAASAPLPTITSATVSGGITRIIGSVPGVPGTQYLVDLFVNTACDLGAGEGEYFLGNINVTAGANGQAAIDVALNAALLPGRAITATTTHAGLNTSMFSPCATVR